MSRFVQSRYIGKHGEELIKKLLNFSGIECNQNEEYKSKDDYDLICKIGKSKFTIESKYDRYSQKSGNLAIEFYNPKSKKPSGIASTKATIWGLIINDMDYQTIWLTKVDTLKEFIKNNKPAKTIQSVGDGNASIHLYKVENILPIFTRIDNLEKEDIVKTIKNLIKKPRKKIS